MKITGAEMLATVTDKGQVTVPKNIRDQLHIATGSKLDFEVDVDGSLRVRVLERGSDKLFGLVHRPGIKPLSIKEMDEGVVAATKARNQRSRK